MVHTRPQLIHSHMCSRWYTPDIHVHMVTWVAHGTYQAYKYSTLTFKHLFHHTTKACMPAENNRLNVCSQDMTACFTFALAANRMSAKCFLTCPTGWKSPGTVVGVTLNLPALTRRDKADWQYGVQWLPPSQKTYCVRITETSRLTMLWWENVDVYCENYGKQIQRGQNVDSLNVKMTYAVITVP
jgi:hypothetical protein